MKKTLRRWYKSKNFWLHLAAISALPFLFAIMPYDEYRHRPPGDIAVAMAWVSIALTPFSLGMFVWKKWGFVTVLRAIKDWLRSKNFWLQIATIPTLLPIIVFYEMSQSYRGERDLEVFIPLICLIGFCLIMNAIRKNPSD